jgi:hypothetical protein
MALDLGRISVEADSMTADGQPRHTSYLPLNSGRRFSLKARTPS